MDQIISCLYGYLNNCCFKSKEYFLPVALSAVLLSSKSWSYLYIRYSIRRFKSSYENVDLWILSFINSFRWSASVRLNDWKKLKTQTYLLELNLEIRQTDTPCILIIGLKYINLSYSVIFPVIPYIRFFARVSNFRFVSDDFRIAENKSA